MSKADLSSDMLFCKFACASGMIVYVLRAQAGITIVSNTAALSESGFEQQRLGDCFASSMNALKALVHILVPQRLSTSESSQIQAPPLHTS
eukprot:scaffold5262_cov46-Prasinocladus_malaysianus.AAC.1